MDAQATEARMMEAQVQDLVRTVTAASDEERILFPDVVRMLMDAGVERYHADLVAATKTYYMPDGALAAVSCHPVAAPASTFAPQAVEAAVRASQARAIGYRTFCTRIAAAGCVGYFVTLAGRRAVYYGRNGDTHTEWFPGAAP